METNVTLGEEIAKIIKKKSGRKIQSLCNTRYTTRSRSR